MLDGRVLGASQVEYRPSGKPPLKREGNLWSQFACCSSTLVAFKGVIQDCSSALDSTGVRRQGRAVAVLQWRLHFLFSQQVDSKFAAFVFVSLVSLVSVAQKHKITGFVLSHLFHFCLASKTGKLAGFVFVSLVSLVSLVSPPPRSPTRSHEKPSEETSCFFPEPETPP